MIERVALAPSAYAPHRGGVEEVVAQLADALSGRGTEVSVTTMRWPKTLPRHDRVEGIPVRRQLLRAHIGDPRRRVVAAVAHPLSLADLLAHYRRFRPDVVNVHCVSHAAQFHRQAAKLLRIPFVVSVHGELTADADQIFERQPGMRALLRRCLDDADAVTACSRGALRDLEGWYGSRFGERASVIHNGISRVAFEDANPAERARPYVFAVGRHVPQKGLDILIEAYARTALRERGVELVLAGTGNLTQELERLAEDVGATGTVWFVGQTERAETASLMRGAVAVALPSRQEAFGIVALEAMAAGTPLIASRVGGLPEFVEDGINGLLVPPGDVYSLSAALDRVTADHALADRLVAGGRATVNGRDWVQVTDAYTDVFRRAIEHRRGR